MVKPGEEGAIAKDATSGAGSVNAGLSILFAEGLRPSANDVVRLSQTTVHIDTRPTAFSVTHRASNDAGELELLASGLAFDLAGLSPARPARLPERRHDFATQANALGLLRAEAITLAPGPHLAGGEALLPVVRVMTGLGATLCELPGVLAVVWNPARSWMGPVYFLRIVSDWLAGGPFPALGLTGLTPDPDGGLRSEGLSFFTGQELRMEPGVATSQSAAAKLAVRLIHRLVDAGPVRGEIDVTTEDGAALHIEASANGRFLRVRRLDR